MRSVKPEPWRAEDLPMVTNVDDVIRRVLAEEAKLVVEVSEVFDSDDLQRLGMSSHALVSVMLGLEDEFGIEFPDQLLTKSTFGSINSIRSAIALLTN